MPGRLNFEGAPTRKQSARRPSELNDEFADLARKQMWDDVYSKLDRAAADIDDYDAVRRAHQGNGSTAAQPKAWLHP